MPCHYRRRIINFYFYFCIIYLLFYYIVAFAFVAAYEIEVDSLKEADPYYFGVGGF